MSVSTNGHFMTRSLYVTMEQSALEVIGTAGFVT